MRQWISGRDHSRFGQQSPDRPGELQYAIGQNLIAASREAAQEGYKDHGVLTYALLETLHLAEPGPEDEVNVVRLAQNAGRRVPQITQETSGVRQIPFQKLSGSDFPIGLRRKVLSPGGGGIPSDPTHILVRNEILREKPSAEAAGNRELNRGFRVRLVEIVDNTWGLVAREGQPIGYLPIEALVKPF